MCLPISTRYSIQLFTINISKGYGGGTSETRICEVRKWYEETQLHNDKNKIKNENSTVIVATKFLPTLWRWTKGSFYKSLRGSLQRLNVDTIDLYFIHTPIHPLPIEWFIQWSCDAIDDGLIRYIGISNCNAELVRRAHAVAQRNGKHIECNQIMLNLLVWNSPKHQETVRTCHELNIQIAAYSPIGQGLLTDGLTKEKFNSIRAVKMTGVKYEGELNTLRNEIHRLSVIHNKTMAQVAMNWVRGHGAMPLVGIRSVTQVKDAQEVLNWSLSNDEIKKLDDLSLGLSLFERPLLRRCMFVVFISLLQLAYYTEQRYTNLKKKYSTWFSSGASQKREHSD